MNGHVSRTNLMRLLVVLSVGFTRSPWVALAITGLWSLWWLPDWVGKWLDVRDR